MTFYLNVSLSFDSVFSQTHFVKTVTLKRLNLPLRRAIFCAQLNRTRELHSVWFTFFQHLLTVSLSILFCIKTL